MAYATLVAEAGPFADPREVREHLDKALLATPKSSKGPKFKRPGAALSAAQARQMASDLDDYDSKIVKGRLRG